MPKINMRVVSIGPKSFEPQLDLVREAMPNFKLRERIMFEGKVWTPNNSLLVL